MHQLPVPLTIKYPLYAVPFFADDFAVVGKDWLVRVGDCGYQGDWKRLTLRLALAAEQQYQQAAGCDRNPLSVRPLPACACLRACSSCSPARLHACLIVCTLLLTCMPASLRPMSMGMHRFLLTIGQSMNQLKSTMGFTDKVRLCLP